MSASKIVHLCHDTRWTLGAHHLFEKAFPGQNQYIALRSHLHRPIKFIAHFDPLILLSFKELNHKHFYLLKEASLVVVHGLVYQHARVVNKLLPEKKVLWIIMGTEMYQNPYIYNKKIYGNKTRALKRKIDRKLHLINTLKDIIRWVRVGQNTQKYIASVAGKIDYVGSFQQEQFDLLKKLKAIPAKAERLHFAFYPLEFIIDSNQNINTAGSHILLGNSASFTSNHQEAIDKLAHLDLTGRKVYVPLSYGNNKYAQKIIEYGNKKLGVHFTPLKERIPLEQYNKILNSCGIVIMNHYRGQAVGNIISSLFLGNKLLISEMNPIYMYLKRIGCHIYSIEEELSAGRPNIFQPLTNEQILENRRALMGEVSEAVLVDSLKKNISERHLI